MSHSDDLHKTKVMIFGSEYVLSSEESEEYTLKISNFVDQKMNLIAAVENTGDTARIALMAAFDIANQIVRQRTLRREDRRRIDEALRCLEQQIDERKKMRSGGSGRSCISHLVNQYLKIVNKIFHPALRVPSIVPVILETPMRFL